MVCGIADVRMQRALLAEPQLTFTKALQMIQTMETADRDSRELQAQTTSPVPVNTVSRVARFLSRYRTTPQSTTGTTPAELMFGRKLRTRLDLLKPDLEVAVRRKQTKQKAAHDYHATDCSFKEGAYVYVYNQAGSPKWLPGTIIKKTGFASYLVQLENSQKQLSQHQDHIRLRLAVAETQTTGDHQGDNLDDMEDILPVFSSVGETNVTLPSPSPSPSPSPPPPRRSQRIRRPPQQYI